MVDGPNTYHYPPSADQKEKPDPQKSVLEVSNFGLLCSKSNFSNLSEALKECDNPFKTKNPSIHTLSKCMVITLLMNDFMCQEDLAGRICFSKNENEQRLFFAVTFS